MAEPRRVVKFYFLSQLVVPRDASCKPSIAWCLCFMWFSKTSISIQPGKNPNNCKDGFLGGIESHSSKLFRTKAFPPPDLADVLSTSSTVIGTKRKGLWSS